MFLVSGCSWVWVLFCRHMARDHMIPTPISGVCGGRSTVYNQSAQIVKLDGFFKHQLLSWRIPIMVQSENVGEWQWNLQYEIRNYSKLRTNKQDCPASPAKNTFNIGHNYYNSVTSTNKPMCLFHLLWLCIIWRGVWTWVSWSYQDSFTVSSDLAAATCWCTNASEKNNYLGSVRTVKTTQEKHTSFMYAFPESKVPTDSYHGSGMGPGISSRA